MPSIPFWFLSCLAIGCVFQFILKINKIFIKTIINALSTRRMYCNKEPRKIHSLKYITLAKKFILNFLYNVKFFDGRRL